MTRQAKWRKDQNQALSPDDIPFLLEEIAEYLASLKRYLAFITLVVILVLIVQACTVLTAHVP